MREVRLLLVMMLVVPLANIEGQQTQSRMAKGAVIGGLLAGGAAFRYWARRSPQMGRLLLKALRGGNDLGVKLLVVLGAKINRDDINTLDTYGMTPLHYAAYEGYDAIVRDLIAAGATVNAVNTVYGWTPLHLAAYGGHDAIVRDLIAAGATINAVNTDGNTPLHYTAYGGNDAAVRDLIAAGATINAVDTDGNTPLHLAAYGGHDAIVRDLIAAGATINAVDTDGNTPLYYAARPDDERARINPKNIENVIKILLEYGATGEERGTLNGDQTSRLNRVIRRIDERRQKTRQAVSEVKRDIPEDIAGMISKFAY